jgi:hypothetical protein
VYVVTYREICLVYRQSEDALERAELRRRLREIVAAVPVPPGLELLGDLETVEPEPARPRFFESGPISYFDPYRRDLIRERHDEAGGEYLERLGDDGRWTDDPTLLDLFTGDPFDPMSHPDDDLVQVTEDEARAIAAGWGATLEIGTAPARKEAPPQPIDSASQPLDQSALRGLRFEEALVYTAQVHAEQKRKGTQTPYLAHLLGVAALVLGDGGSEDEAIAALLHDAVEDAGGHERLEDIRARFGECVAGIVAECSDSVEQPKPPWRKRKEAYIAHLGTASEAALRVSLADKLDNARAILRDYRECGEELWKRFNAGRESQLWYYRSLAEAFQERCPGPMADELARVVGELEAIAEAPN